jgi:hypothetical protein
MSTESEILLARYRQVERESDNLGRIIGVRRLRPSELTKLAGMTPELGGVEDVPEIGEDKQRTGRSIPISRRMPLMIVAAVCEIDDGRGNLQRIPFPKSRGELDSIYDRLDTEGIDAASRAFLKLVESTSPIRTEEEAKEEAKNL